MSSFSYRCIGRLLVPLLLLAATSGLLASTWQEKPYSLFGTIAIAGTPVPDGAELSVEIAGVVYETALVFTTEEGASFSLDVPEDLTETVEVDGGREGDEVVLRLDGSPIPQTLVWRRGGIERLDLDLEPGPDLAVTVDDGRAIALPGETLTYALEATNVSSLDASGVVLRLELPVGATLVSASDGGVELGAGIVEWPAVALAAGASLPRSATVALAPTYAAGIEALEAVALVRHDGALGPDPDASNSWAVDSTTLDATPDLVVGKSDGRDSVAPGDTLVYTLTVSNVGTQGASGVVLSDPLPADTTFFTASDDGIELPPGTITWPAIELEAGAMLTRTLTLRFDGAQTGETLENTASATASNGETDPTDNSATDIDSIEQQSDFHPTLVDVSGAFTDPQSLEISGLVAVTVENLGNAGAVPFALAIFEDLDLDGALSAGDTVLAQEVVAGVEGGTSQVFELAVTGTLTFRGNRLFALADADDQLAERDEENNLAHSATGCEAAPGVGDFAPRVELRWPEDDSNLSEPNSRESMSTPIVIHLTDDDGDGVIGSRDDVPDVVFVTANLVNPLDPKILLRAISGDTGRSLFAVLPSASEFKTFALAGLAAGDLDGDGSPEIVVSTPSPPLPPFTGFSNHLTAYNRFGQRLWSSDAFVTHPTGATFTNRDHPTIADLEGDGLAEIVVGANVFDHLGHLQWAGSGGQAYQSARNDDASDSGAISIVADLDLDGSQDVVTGNTVYRADGSILWQVAEDDGYPAVADFDADGLPEVVVVARGRLRLHSGADGALLWGPVDLPGSGAEAGGAPTVADFDGDGAPEIGVAGSTQYAVFEGDGTVLWQRTIRDGSSNQTGSTVFDLDGDGHYEVIYRDEEKLRIYRGDDGVVLFETPVSSFTANEEPVVADVDGDGRAEILVSSDLASGLGGIATRTSGLFVYGDANDNWIGTRGVWNQHAYHGDNVGDDGSIPMAPTPSWLTHNTFRANLPPAEGARAAANLTASRLVVDFGAYPVLGVSVRIGNGGLLRAPAGVPVTFWDGDPTTGGTLIATAFTDRALDPGEYLDLAIETLSPGFGPATVVAWVGDDGSGAGGPRECVQGDNQHRLDYSTDPVGLLAGVDNGVDAVRPGDTVRYTLSAGNGNSFDRTGVRIESPLPAHASFVAASDGGALGGDGIVRWPATDLPARTTATRTLDLLVDPSIPLDQSFAVSATVADDGSHGPDPTPENNTATDTDAVLTVRADAGGPYAGGEGEAIIFDASGSTDLDGTIVDYAWDLDADGLFDDATGVTASRSFDNEGTYTIAVQITDDAGEQDTASAEVVVTNRPPVVDAGADRSMVETGTLSITVAYSDPGTLDSHTATLDWGDGTIETVGASGGTVSGSHAYPDDALVPVTVCVTDDAGATGCDAFQLTVTNSDPVVLGTAYTIDHRGWHAEDLFPAKPSDWRVESGGDVWQRANEGPTVFIGDLLATGLTTAGLFKVQTYSDDDAIGWVLGYEPGDFLDPEADYLVIDWRKLDESFVGAGGETYIAPKGLAVSRVRGLTSGTGLGTHRFEAEELQRGSRFGHRGWDHNKWYRWKVTLESHRLRLWIENILELDIPGDFDFGEGRFGYFDSSQQDYRINSAITIDARPGREGDPVEVRAVWEEASPLDTHTGFATWGDGTGEQPATVTPGAPGVATASHVYADNGIYAAELCVEDDDGGVDCWNGAMTVSNQPPVVESPILRPAFPGEPFTLDLAFSDPGTGDTHTAMVDWGDGTTSVAQVVESDGAGVAMASHVYADDGLGAIHPVTVCVTDDDGDTGCGSTTAEVFAISHDLAIRKQATLSAALPGEPLVYTLVVDNLGTREPRGLVVRDDLPAELSFVSASEGGVYDAASHRVTWQLPVLRIGTSAYFHVETLAPTSSAGGFLINRATVSDDGRYGPDLWPDDNVAQAETPLAAVGTPLVDAGLRNLAREPSSKLRSSPTEPFFGAERLADGDLRSNWWADCGTSANQGGSPWAEVVLGEPSTVRELRLFGDRQFVPRHPVLAGIFTFYDSDGAVIYSTGEVSFEGTNHDYLLRLADLRGVGRMRLDIMADQTCNPAIGELEVWGFPGDEDQRLVLDEGGRAALHGRVQDTAVEAHTLDVDWGDGSTFSRSLGSANEHLFLERHIYPADGVYAAEVCVRDPAQLASCEVVEVVVENTAPRPIGSEVLALGTWNAETYAIEGDHEAPIWEETTEGGLRQLAHSAPAVLQGPLTALGSQVELTLRLGPDPDQDDDFAGFVIGYEPGDHRRSSADYLLLDWRRINAGSALRGLALSRVTGVPYELEFWQHANGGRPDFGVQQLARGATLGSVGWVFDRDYRFRFDIRADRLRVWVDDVLELDLVPPMPLANGKLGFYALSQRVITWNGFGVPGGTTVEGGSSSLSGFFQDAGVGDLHTATIDWGDGTFSTSGDGSLVLEQGSGDGRLSASHIFLDDLEGLPGVTVCVRDDAGAEGCGTWPVQVSNLPPVLDPLADVEGFATVPFALAGIAFTDPGVLDTHTATVDWGDGETGEAMVSQGAGGGTLSAEHIYAEAGIYTVTLCVSDDDGGSACQSLMATFDEAPAGGDTTVCEPRLFDAVGEQGPEWTLDLLGDADQGSAVVLGAGAVLLLEGDGTSLYHDGDHGAFYHRAISAAADFRIEVDLSDFPVDTGGQVRKAVLMLRSGLDPWAARAMVTFVPHLPGPNEGDPDSPALQFDARLADGEGAVEIGNTVSEGIGLGTRLAIEKRGDTASVYYSLDGGTSWIRPVDATYHGVATIDWSQAGETLYAGVMVASYDADTTLTAEAANFAVCRPGDGGVYDPPTPPLCDPAKPIDALVLLDTSGSMTADFGGASSKLAAAQAAIRELLADLAARGDGSRAALVTYAGHRMVAENLAGVSDLLSPFTTDLAAVDALAQAIDGSSIDTGTPTATALALTEVIETLITGPQGPGFDPAHQPAIFWLSDGVANIDHAGRGPDAYELEALQAIPLRDGDGDGEGGFRSWSDVGWSGDFNPELGTFDGEPLANAMFQLERLDRELGDVLVYGLALEGDGAGLGTSQSELLAYGAHVSGGRAFETGDLATLLAATSAVATDLDCGGLGTAVIAGRLWHDRDADGTQSADTSPTGEPGLAGVIVDLFDDAGLGLTTRTTGEGGTYTFGDLGAGTYIVGVDATTLPLGEGGEPLDVPTHDLDGTVTVDMATLTVADGELRSDVDFGYRERDPAPPTETCTLDGFDTGALDPAWQLVELGDADQGSAAIVGGALHLGSDGTSLFHGDDNGTFVHRIEPGGDFRVEARITGVPDNTGGPVRKGCLMVRTGTGVRDARVMACYIPNLPDAGTTGLQFDVRHADGSAEEIATVVLNATLPVSLAIESQAGVVRVEYRYGNEGSWIRPMGLLEGTIALDLGTSPLVGLMVASYDADLTTTVAFDDVELCRPNPAAL